MSRNIKQKGFIPTSILITIIVFIVIVPTVIIGVDLHKQGELVPLIANIFQAPKKIADVKLEDSKIGQFLLEETNQEENFQIQTEQELKQIKLQNEKVQIVAEEERNQEYLVEQETISSIKNSADIEATNIEQSESQNSREMVIDSLLENPTFEKFKVFCVKAKTLQGDKQKEILDTSRESIIFVPNSLYEEINDCSVIEKYSDRSIVYSLPDNNLYLPLKDSDTDIVRKARIAYNNALKEVSENSKFIIFYNSMSDDFENDNGIDHNSLVSALEYWLDQLNEEEWRLNEFKRSITDVFLHDPIVKVKEYE